MEVLQTKVCFIFFRLLIAHLCVVYAYLLALVELEFEAFRESQYALRLLLFQLRDALDGY